jgi:hypothetical protein
MNMINLSRFVIKLLLFIVPLLIIAVWFFIVKNRSMGSIGGAYYNLAPLLGAFVLGLSVVCYEVV